MAAPGLRFAVKSMGWSVRIFEVEASVPGNVGEALISMNA